VVHPAGDRIYAVQYGSVSRWNVVDGLPAYAWSGPATLAQPCAPLWIAPDGRRLYTGCGTALRTAATQSVDMNYNGSLGDLAVGALDAVGSTVAALARPLSTPNYGDGLPRSLHLYDAEFLRHERELPLPGFDRHGEPWPSRGRFVFVDGTESRAILLLQAKDGSGLEHAQGYAVIDL
jgi:hypothetical protein